jgi:hypothetical protein
MRLLFLGTGASGGTPGRGRSRRLESAVLLSDRATLLIDVTRLRSPGDTPDPRRRDRADARASGRDRGLPALRRWWLANHAPEPIDIFLSEATANIICTRYRRLEHCRPRLNSSRRHSSRRAARPERPDRPARPGSALPHVRLARVGKRTIGRVRLRPRPPDRRAGASSHRARRSSSSTERCGTGDCSRI